MDQLEKQDVIRLKELLRRTGEFIAYFELAETKMMEWRQEVEQRERLQHEKIKQQLETLQLESESLQNALTEAGLARFRLVAENNLLQEKEHLHEIQQMKTQILKQISDSQVDMTQLSQQILKKIHHHSEQSLTAIDLQLSQHDVQQFNRIANESCEQIHHSARDALNKSRQLLKLFHWRTAALSLLTTLVTVFALSLYMSDEYPWEIHQHAQNERNAGKMLMTAWPQLTHQEKIKILGEQPASRTS